MKEIDMSRVWITSDLHIGHNRDFVYEDRGFGSIEEHDEALLANWNELVDEDDTVYILGDVMLKKDLQDINFSYGISVLKKLKGKLIIFRGNHDSDEKIERYMECSNVISAGHAAMYLDYPETGSYHFYLSHYPTLISHEKLKQMKAALINLYGHTHQKERFYNDHPYMYCVCLDAHDMRPVLLEDIIEEVRKKKWDYREADCDSVSTQNTRDK